jgi:ribosomal protein L7/L12
MTSARALRFSFVRDGSPFARTVRLVTRATRWRHRESRQVWLIVLALVIAICAGAIAVPAERSDLLCAVIGLVAVGFDVTGRQQRRRERATLAARPVALSSDDLPADVIELIAADKKIRAIKRYRELTGAGLREAKAVIDSAVREG